jgi:predicted nucleic acid-binding protein
MTDDQGRGARLPAARQQRGRKLPELLIAAAAEMRGLTALHYDSPFDQIAAATGQYANGSWP